MTISARIRSQWDGQPCGFFWSFLSLSMLPLSFVYGIAMRVRALFYSTGIIKTHKLPRPVISIGNLTVGGTGKTPVTAFIARFLLEKGFKVTVISRGYGGSLEGRCAVLSDGYGLLLGPDECGDEPYMLASSVPGLAVVTGSDRYAAGMVAMERTSPDIFLLDDGFQHMRLHRDLNLMLMDCSRPIGNGRVLPAGPLREPVSAGNRADLLIYTRCTPESLPASTTLSAIPGCRLGYRLVRFVRLDSGESLDVAKLQQQRCVAVTGIARPASFFDGLIAVGVDLVARIDFPDHEPFSSETVAKIRITCEKYSAAFILVTAKDGVKLASKKNVNLPIIVVVELELDLQDIGPLMQKLDKLLSNGTVLGHNS